MSKYYSIPLCHALCKKKRSRMTSEWKEKYLKGERHVTWQVAFPGPSSPSAWQDGCFKTSNYFKGKFSLKPTPPPPPFSVLPSEPFPVYGPISFRGWGMFRSYLLGFLHALTVFVRKWWLWMSSGRCLFFLELFKLTPCCFLCFYRFFFYFHPFIQQFLFNCQLRFSSKETNNFISIFKSCIVKGICLFEDLIFENLIFENREGISLFGERIF